MVNIPLSMLASFGCHRESPTAYEMAEYRA